MADKPRWLIAITPAEPTENEEMKIGSILRAGWHRVHLRHPEASRDEVRHIIKNVPQEFHGRIVLHGHFDLTKEFNLGGLHLNRRSASAPESYAGPLSRSCHSLTELSNDGNNKLEYVTLSPIFDSISKIGYSAAFSGEELLALKDIATPVIALGGISPDNISLLSDYNFAGYAMLGAIPWDASGQEIFKFAINTFNRLTIC